MPENNSSIKNMFYNMKKQDILDIYKTCPEYPFDQEAKDLIALTMIQTLSANNEFLQSFHDKKKLAIYFLEASTLHSRQKRDALRTLYEQVFDTSTVNPLVVKFLKREKIHTLAEDQIKPVLYSIVKAAYCLYKAFSWIELNDGNRSGPSYKTVLEMRVNKVKKFMKMVKKDIPDYGGYFWFLYTKLLWQQKHSLVGQRTKIVRYLIKYQCEKFVYKNTLLYFTANSLVTDIDKVNECYNLWIKQDIESHGTALDALYAADFQHTATIFVCYLHFLLYSSENLKSKYFQCRFICKYAITLYARMRDLIRTKGRFNWVLGLMGGRFLFKLVLEAMSLLKNTDIVVDAVMEIVSSGSSGSSGLGAAEEIQEDVKNDMMFLLFCFMRKKFPSPLAFQKNHALALVEIIKHFTPSVIEALLDEYSLMNSYLNEDYSYDGYQSTESVYDYSMDAEILTNYYKTRADFIQRSSSSSPSLSSAGSCSMVGFIPLSLASTFFKWNIKGLLELKDEFIIKKLVPRYEYFLRKRQYFQDTLKYKSKCVRCSKEDQFTIPSNCYHFFCSDCYVKCMHDNTCPSCKLFYAF